MAPTTATAQVEAVEPALEIHVEQEPKQAPATAAVDVQSLCLRCGQPCLTCSPPIVIETPRRLAHRPKGSGTYSTAELRQLVLVDAERLWREGNPPTLRLVGLKIGYSADGLSRALVDRDLSWPAIRSDAYRRSCGRFRSGAAA